MAYNDRSRRRKKFYPDPTEILQNSDIGVRKMFAPPPNLMPQDMFAGGNQHAQAAAEGAEQAAQTDQILSSIASVAGSAIGAKMADKPTAKAPVELDPSVPTGEMPIQTGPKSP